MAQRDAQYNLNWWANSEHGGAFNRNAFLSGYDIYAGKDANGKILGATSYWDTYSPAQLLGNSNGSGHLKYVEMAVIKRFFLSRHKSRSSNVSK